MRALGIASRLVVSLWLVALLASMAPREHEVSAPATPRARVQALAVETPPEQALEEPAPARPAVAAPEPPAPAPPTARELVATPADLARGAALLGNGSFPVISASYEALGSFRRYAAAMTAVGGRFVVVSRREVAAEIDVTTGAMRDAALDRPFSPRARDYTDEPALAEPARRARERHGPDAEIMLLVPRALDAGLFGAIARELEARGERHEDYREIEGRYERGADGGLRFRLVSGMRMDGRRVALPAILDLSAGGAARG